MSELSYAAAALTSPSYTDPIALDGLAYAAAARVKKPVKRVFTPATPIVVAGCGLESSARIALEMLFRSS